MQNAQMDSPNDIAGGVRVAVASTSSTVGAESSRKRKQLWGIRDGLLPQRPRDFARAIMREAGENKTQLRKIIPRKGERISLTLDLFFLHTKSQDREKILASRDKVTTAGHRLKDKAAAALLWLHIGMLDYQLQLALLAREIAKRKARGRSSTNEVVATNPATDKRGANAGSTSGSTRTSQDNCKHKCPFDARRGMNGMCEDIQKLIDVNQRRLLNLAQRMHGDEFRSIRMEDFEGMHPEFDMVPAEDVLEVHVEPQMELGEEEEDDSDEEVEPEMEEDEDEEVDEEQEVEEDEEEVYEEEEIEEDEEDEDEENEDEENEEDEAEEAVEKRDTCKAEEGADRPDLPLPASTRSKYVLSGFDFESFLQPQVNPPDDFDFDCFLQLPSDQPQANILDVNTPSMEMSGTGMPSFQAMDQAVLETFNAVPFKRVANQGFQLEAKKRPFSTARAGDTSQTTPDSASTQRIEEVLRAPVPAGEQRRLDILARRQSAEFRAELPAENSRADPGAQCRSLQEQGSKEMCEAPGGQGLYFTTAPSRGHMVYTSDSRAQLVPACPGQLIEDFDAYVDSVLGVRREAGLGIPGVSAASSSAPGVGASHEASSDPRPGPPLDLHEASKPEPTPEPTPEPMPEPMPELKFKLETDPLPARMRLSRFPEPSSLLEALPTAAKPFCSPGPSTPLHVLPPVAYSSCLPESSSSLLEALPAAAKPFCSAGPPTPLYVLPPVAYSYRPHESFSSLEALPAMTQLSQPPKPSSPLDAEQLPGEAQLAFGDPRVDAWNIVLFVRDGDVLMETEE